MHWARCSEGGVQPGSGDRGRKGGGWLGALGKVFGEPLCSMPTVVKHTQSVPHNNRFEYRLPLDTTTQQYYGAAHDAVETLDFLHWHQD